MHDVWIRSVSVERSINGWLRLHVSLSYSSYPAILSRPVWSWLYLAIQMIHPPRNTPRGRADSPLVIGVQIDHPIIAIICIHHPCQTELLEVVQGDRKSTRLNSSHANISYAVFC